MKKLLVICIAGLVALPLFADGPVEVRPFTMSGARERGMGGPHVAFTDNVLSLFVNPAALHESNEKSFFEIGIGTHGPLFEIIDIAKSAQGAGNQELIDQIGAFAKKAAAKSRWAPKCAFRFPLGTRQTGLVLACGTRCGSTQKSSARTLRRMPLWILFSIMACRSISLHLKGLAAISLTRALS